MWVSASFRRSVLAWQGAENATGALDTPGFWQMTVVVSGSAQTDEHYDSASRDTR
jgi:hypothetical protein